MDVSGVLHMRPPPPEKIKAAMTQAEMTAVSVPVLEGAEVDANFKVVAEFCCALHLLSFSSANTVAYRFPTNACLACHCMYTTGGLCQGRQRSFQALEIHTHRS